MNIQHTLEHWKAGLAYENYVGRWSRRVADQFVDWLNPEPHGRWLDVGCGTGALTSAILSRHDPSEVTGIAPSEDFLELARRQTKDGRAAFEPGDAEAIPAATHVFDLAVSGLVLNFVADQAKALSEMVRVVRPGGTIAVYVWDYAGHMQFMRQFWDAAAELDPKARELDEGARFPLCRPKPLSDLFNRAGLSAIELRSIDIATGFIDFDDFWRPFLGGQGPAPTYCMGLETRARNRLRENLRRRVPTDPDGAILLAARAWAIQGQVG